MVPLDTVAANLSSQVLDQAAQVTRLLRDLVRSDAIALVAMDTGVPDPSLTGR